eukprot:gene12516-836_t
MAEELQQGRALVTAPAATTIRKSWIGINAKALMGFI